MDRRHILRRNIQVRTGRTGCHCIHEGLHVALRHVQRGKRSPSGRQGYDPQIWNIACDVVINQAIRTAIGAFCGRTRAFPALPASNAMQKRAAQLWTAEEIYSE